MAGHQKTVLITGASSGIGKAAAELFARRRWNVAATMRDPSVAYAHDYTRADHVAVTALDVTDRASIDRAVDETIRRFGRIDVLINNAGYGLNGPVEGASEAQILRQFDVNLFGVVRVMQSVLPQMRARRSGVIVNISSIGGLIGMPGSPLYISTKHALEGLTESQRFELAPFGIRMKLVEPGGIRTDFISRSSDWTTHPDYAGQIAALRAMTRSLDPNLADPRGVARVIYRAASDRSRRLRYLAEPGPYVWLHRLLPDWAWRSLIEAALRMHARSDQRG